MSEEDRNNFKTYMVKEKDFTDLIIKDKEDNYYYSAIYVNELQQEIERLNNITNKVKQQLLNKKDIVEKSKYFKLVYYTDWNMEHEWDKSIVDKIDEIINIIDEENK